MVTENQRYAKTLLEFSSPLYIVKYFIQVLFFQKMQDITNIYYYELTLGVTDVTIYKSLLCTASSIWPF